MEREKDPEAYLRKKICEMGGLFWKLVSPGNAGVPDRLAIMPDGKLIFVEMKTSNGRLRPLQIFQRSELRKRGQKVRVVKGQEDAEAFVQELRRNHGKRESEK